MNDLINHISPDKFQDYLDQILDQAENQEIERHLNQCPHCRDDMARLEKVFTDLKNLPEVQLDKDLSIPVLARLREETKLSQGLTWTLVLETLGAGIVLGLLIPALRTASWLPQLIDTQTEIQAAVNIFSTQLASTWLVWWAGLRLNYEQFTKTLFSPVSLPVSEISPWILILAAAGIGILVNIFLLRSDPLRNQNHEY